MNVVVVVFVIAVCLELVAVAVMVVVNNRLRKRLNSTGVEYDFKVASYAALLGLCRTADEGFADAVEAYADECGLMRSQYQFLADVASAASMKRARDMNRRS